MQGKLLQVADDRVRDPAELPLGADRQEGLRRLSGRADELQAAFVSVQERAARRAADTNGLVRHEERDVVAAVRTFGLHRLDLPRIVGHVLVAMGQIQVGQVDFLAVVNHWQLVVAGQIGNPPRAP